MGQIVRFGMGAGGIAGGCTAWLTRTPVGTTAGRVNWVAVLIFAAIAAAIAVAVTWRRDRRAASMAAHPAADPVRHPQLR